MVQRCLRLRSRKATMEELQSVHSPAYAMFYGNDPHNRDKASGAVNNFVMLPCGGIGVDSDTTWNDYHTPSAARTAAGCVMDLAFKGSHPSHDIHLYPNPIPASVCHIKSDPISLHPRKRLKWPPISDYIRQNGLCVWPYSTESHLPYPLDREEEREPERNREMK